MRKQDHKEVGWQYRRIQELSTQEDDDNGSGVRGTGGIPCNDERGLERVGGCQGLRNKNSVVQMESLHPEMDRVDESSQLQETFSIRGEDCTKSNYGHAL